MDLALPPVEEAERELSFSHFSLRFLPSLWKLITLSGREKVDFKEVYCSCPSET